MYKSRLSAIITEEHVVECKEFIKEYREQRHKSVMERQKRNISSYGIRNTRVAIAVMVQVATQTRTKIPRPIPVPNIGLQIYPTNLYLWLKRQSWHMDLILWSPPRPPFQEYITAVEGVCQSLKPALMNSELTLLQC